MADAAPSERLTQPTVRAQIIEAASLCFEREGIRRSTMQQIANHVGVSRQTVYDHFASKADLVGEVMLAFARSGYHRILGGLDYALPAGEVVAAAQGELTRYFRTPRGQMLLSPADRDIIVQVAQRIRVIDVSCDEYWVPILERLRDAGNIRHDIDIADAARWLYFLNYAYTQHAAFDGEPQARLDRAFTAPGLAAMLTDKPQ